MKQLLDNLLARPGVPKQICTVVRPLPGGRYQVRDSSGLLTVDDSTGTAWKAGEQVIVSSLRIVKRGGRSKQPGVTEV